MNKTIYDFVFVVLTYRNSDDLKNFILDTKKQIKDKFHIVVVNSFYDNPSLNEIKDIAVKNGCDFINVENKGYGYGNNRGIEYVISNISFKYLVISNPDIKILSMDLKDLDTLQKCIVAPYIINKNGKVCNPYSYFEDKIFERLYYYLLQNKKVLFSQLYFVLNGLITKMNRAIDKIFKIKKRKVYAAHGCFLIFGHEALDSLGLPYDEQIFLFSEEYHLAQFAKQKNIKTIYLPYIQVLHLEDGSMQHINANNKIKNLHKESYIKYFERWH